MNRRLALEHLNALAADPMHCTRTGLAIRIDPQRPFVPEHHTQLYYTPLYAGLTHGQRLRYNQLSGLRLNEYIMMLESDLADRLLVPLLGHPQVRHDPALARAVQTMIDEERRHFDGFVALNQACRPDLYPPDAPRRFSRLPGWTRLMFAAVGLAARRHAFALWYMMAMEEAAKSLAREMAQQPETETLGPLDEGFRAVHLEHLKDETRHLHIDEWLIERCMPPQRQRANAWLFQQMLAGVVRPTRHGSGARVIRQLVADCPELAPREEALVQSLLALRDNRRFQHSLFNRRIMPRTFAVFDQTPALAQLGRKMVGYDRQNAA
jgi:hypothetical protein